MIEADPELQSQDAHEESPMNAYEKVGRFVVGAAEGAVGGAVGAFILYKLGVHFKPHLETVLVTSPAITSGLSKLRS